MIERIHRLPYFALRVFLAKRVTERYPHFLYKYRPSLQPDSGAISYVRDLLVEGRFYLSSPRQYNDPFDMTAFVTVEGTEQEKKERFKRLIANIADRQHIPSKERRVWVQQQMSRSAKEIVDVITRSHERHTSATGIFSFAGDPRSILMWSHYGDHHKGICLQFDIARDPHTLLWAVPMKYVRRYPIFNFLQEDKSLDATLLHKFKRWSYECESRIVYPGGAGTYLKFDPHSVVGLIFGCRASESTRKAVHRLLEERAARGLPAPKVYEAEKHPRAYAIVLRRVRAGVPAA